MRLLALASISVVLAGATLSVLGACSALAAIVGGAILQNNDYERTAITVSLRAGLAVLFVPLGVTLWRFSEIDRKLVDATSADLAARRERRRRIGKVLLGLAGGTLALGIIAGTPLMLLGGCSHAAGGAGAGCGSTMGGISLLAIGFGGAMSLFSVGGAFYSSGNAYLRLSVAVAPTGLAFRF